MTMSKSKQKFFLSCGRPKSWMVLGKAIASLDLEVVKYDEKSKGPFTIKYWF